MTELERTENAGNSSGPRARAKCPRRLGKFVPSGAIEKNLGLGLAKKIAPQKAILELGRENFQRAKNGKIVYWGPRALTPLPDPPPPSQRRQAGTHRDGAYNPTIGGAIRTIMVQNDDRRSYRAIPRCDDRTAGVRSGDPLHTVGLYRDKANNPTDGGVIPTTLPDIGDVANR